MRIFLTYPQTARKRLQYLHSQVPESIRAVLPELTGRFESQISAVEINHAFVQALLEEQGLCPKGHELASYKPNSTEDSWVIGALTALKREWSDDGLEERSQSMVLTLEALARLVPLPSDGRAMRPRIALAGAGLCRQAWEVCIRGYAAVAFESAIMMKLVGDFIINHLLRTDRSLKICPYVHELFGPTNVASASNLSRTIAVPDEEALAKARADLASPSGGSLNVIVGDYNERAMQDPGTFDAVLTCFYLDACGDLIQAVDATYTALRSGGIWINCGPLEYDGTSGGHDSGQVRLCADEMLLYIRRRGFELLETGSPHCLYTSDPLSMFQPAFKCCYFAARKVSPPSKAGDKSGTFKC